MQNRVIAFFVICLFKSITINATSYADPLKIALEQLLVGATIEIVPCPCYEAPCQYSIPSYSGCPVYETPCTCAMSLYPFAPIYDAPCSCQCQQYGCQCNIPPPPMCCDVCQCGCELFSTYSQPCDVYPPCSCYRDVKNPCAMYEDAYCHFDSCGCSACQTPYIYFPEVEYPMCVRDMKPYFCGSCWCS